MQSPLAALSLHAPQSAAMGYPQPDETGGGTFAEAFVDVATPVLTDVAPDDSSTSEVIPPVVCGGQMYVSVDFPFPTNTGSVQGAIWPAVEKNCQSATVVEQTAEVGTAAPTPDLSQVPMGSVPLVALPISMQPRDRAPLVGEKSSEQSVAIGIEEWAEIPRAGRTGTQAVVDKASLSSHSTPSRSEPMVTATAKTVPTFITEPDLAVSTHKTPMPVNAVRMFGTDATVNEAGDVQVGPNTGQLPRTQLPGALLGDTNALKDWYGRQVEATAHLGADRCDTQEAACDGPEVRSPSAVPAWPDGTAGTDENGLGNTVSARKIDGATVPTQEPVTTSPVFAAGHVDEVRSDQVSVIGGFWERLYVGSSPSVTFISTCAHDDPLVVGVQATDATSGQGDSTGAASAASPLDLKSRVPPYSSNGTPDVRADRTTAAATGVTETQTDVAIDAAASGWAFSGGDVDWYPQGRWLDSSDLHAPAGLANATSAALKASAGTASLPIQQIASQLAGVLVRNEDDITELALAPEELGRVRLRMEADVANPDLMLIHISVERPETLELLRRHAGELADAIRDAGYAGADIGFGHGGKDGDTEQEARSPAYGGDLPFEEVNQVDVSPTPGAGTSLDLRL